MIVYNDGWASASFSVVGDHKNSEDDHHDSEDGHHDAEDGYRDSEDRSSADSSRPSLSKNSSPQTGDAGEDDVTMCSLLLLFSLVSIVVVKRRSLSQS